MGKDVVRVGYDAIGVQYTAAHAHGIYDLEPDTSRPSRDETVQRILSVVSSPPSPTAFQQLLARMPAPS